MTNAFDFDGKVAVVTGAGSGLGRAYALELACRGAKVLVNDLGGDVDGSGGSAEAAELVVAQIAARGGEALASGASVATPEGGEAIIAAAMEAWGRVDVLINNAGILRDKSFAKLEPADWREVLAVHLDGAYHVSRPALAQMRKQKQGRVVLTSSAAGLYGNFGQANYAAAKLGLVGLMSSLKLEVGRFGVKVNTVAPLAGTRMTRGVVPRELFARLDPAMVVPLVVYLSSDACEASGGIYEAGLGRFSRAALVTGRGLALAGEQPTSPEAVASRVEEIRSLEGGRVYGNAYEALGGMVEACESPMEPAELGEPISFAGQVAIVTGAGGGLGRAYSLALAARGAKVLVNDPGVDTEGSGDSAAPADRVVAEIAAAGGEALASYDSVATPEGGQAIVDQALARWGRVDVLINNAGILRDRRLLKLLPEDWRAVIAVHLDGAYNVTRPAMIKMREQGYGRVLMTSSAAGLYGNVGQCNYSAAKLGVVGLMGTLELEGQKHGVLVNAVAPLAATRMTEGLLPEELEDKLDPSRIAPLVLYLCSDQCRVSGELYNAGMGYFGRAAILGGPAVAPADGECPTVEQIAAVWAELDSTKAVDREHESALAALGANFFG